MGLPNGLILRAVWGGRVDPLESQIAMVWECMERLRSYGGFFTDPWLSLQTRPDDDEPITSFDELSTDMTAAYMRGDGLNYGYCQPAIQDGVDEVRVNRVLDTTLSYDEGWERMAANNAVLMVEPGKKKGVITLVPVEWLLGIGQSLVKDFVDIWQPDLVSLDSMELLDLKPARGNSRPVVGYFTWLSGSVVDPKVLPPTPVCESYKGGVLFGISPDSSDPVGDASFLARQVYGSGVLRLIPFVQGQPNPV